MRKRTAVRDQHITGIVIIVKETIILFQDSFKRKILQCFGDDLQVSTLYADSNIMKIGFDLFQVTQFYGNLFGCSMYLQSKRRHAHDQLFAVIYRYRNFLCFQYKKLLFFFSYLNGFYIKF